MRAHILLACCQRCRTALSSENGTTSPQIGSASQANRQAHTRSRSRLSIPDNRSVFLKSDTASLQLPDEYGSQEENDRHRSQNDSYQLIHGKSSQIHLWPTYSTGGRFALDRVSLREQIAAEAQSLLATTSQRRIHTRPCASRQGALEVAAAHTAPATWLPKWSVRWDRGPTARRAGDVPAADERNLEKVRNAHYIVRY